MVLRTAPAVRPELAGNAVALDAAAILGRRKNTILGVFFVVTLVVAVGAMRTPPVFVAESSLLVRMGREYVYRSEIGRADTARTPSLSEIVNSEVEILASRDLAEQVVVELGVERLYGSLLELGLDQAVTREMAVMRFREATSVRPVLESSVIKVRFEHQSSRIAAEVVNLLVERFKDKHVEVFGEESSSGLEDQLAARRTDLTHAEEALAEFKRTNGVFDLDQQRSILLGQRASAIGEARRAALGQELADLDQREKTLRQLERELTAAESSLQTIRERVEEARISEELDRERRINVRVIEKAAAPVAPAGLSLAMKIGLGACVGLVAGAAVALLQELFRRG